VRVPELPALSDIAAFRARDRRRGRDTATRLLKLARRLLVDREAVTSEFIRSAFGVSHATAKRDMVTLETCLALELERCDEQGKAPLPHVLRARS
jgi:predicted DNA-binding transcriptional regulator YafY